MFAAEGLRVFAIFAFVHSPSERSVDFSHVDLSMNEVLRVIESTVANKPS